MRWGGPTVLLKRALFDDRWRAIGTSAEGTNNAPALRHWKFSPNERREVLEQWLDKKWTSRQATAGIPSAVFLGT